MKPQILAPPESPPTEAQELAIKLRRANELADKLGLALAIISLDDQFAGKRQHWGPVPYVFPTDPTNAA
jgi:hypothetical protein